jgi:hypothetical protein
VLRIEGSGMGKVIIQNPDFTRFLDLRIGDLVNHGSGINLKDPQQRQTLFLSYFFLRVERVGTHNPGYFFTTNILNISVIFRFIRMAVLRNSRIYQINYLSNSIRLVPRHVPCSYVTRYEHLKTAGQDAEKK